MENLQEIQGLAFWLLLIVVSFIQNMVFTAVSRSRQSANLPMHFAWAIASNAVWFFCNFFLLFPTILKTIMEGDLLTKILVGGVYGISTAFGSVFMMYLMLKKVKGKGKVGARIYTLNERDVRAIANLTGRKYLRSAITDALKRNNGVYEDTLRELLG
jgi:hypothetical protein